MVETLSSGNHAAHPSVAELVLPERPGHGKSALRNNAHAPVGTLVRNSIKGKKYFPCGTSTPSVRLLAAHEALVGTVKMAAEVK